MTVLMPWPRSDGEGGPIWRHHTPGQYAKVSFTTTAHADKLSFAPGLAYCKTHPRGNACNKSSEYDGLCDASLAMRPPRNFNVLSESTLRRSSSADRNAINSASAPSSKDILLIVKLALSYTSSASSLHFYISFCAGESFSLSFTKECHCLNGFTRGSWTRNVVEGVTPDVSQSLRAGWRANKCNT